MGSLLLDVKTWFGPALFALLLLCLGAGHQGAYGQSEATDERATVLLPAILAGDHVAGERGAPFAPGQVAVGLRRDVVGAAALERELQANIIETIDLAGLDGEEGDAGVDGYLLQVPVGEERSTIDRLLEDPAVAFAQLNWIVRAAVVDDGEAAHETPFRVDDPLYAGEQWYLQRVLASRAWALSGKVESADAEAPPIQVVVIDSGVDHTHRDLQDNVSLQGRNYIDVGQLPTDDCGHGTHVSGLIAAGINNGVGVAGAAAAVRVVPYKTLEWSQKDAQCVGVVSDIVSAVQDATDAGAQIINLSVDLDQPWAALEAAVNRARSRGVLVIGAAGNCRGALNCPVKYPAAYPAVLSVAATTYDSVRAWYSPLGRDGINPDLAAPGGDDARQILSTWPDNLDGICGASYRIFNGDSFCEQTGTSMAAALVTGEAALIWSVRPQLTAEDVRDILEGTTRPLPQSPEMVGDGLIDADRAVRYALRSRLDVTPRQLYYRLPAGEPAFETTLLLENPSLEPISWLITDTGGIRWLDAAEPVSGTVRYGEPVRAPLVVSAAQLISGTYRDSFAVEGERADGSSLVIPVAAALDVFTPATTSRLYMPLLAERNPGDPVWPYVEYRWETPDTTTPGAMGRVERVLFKDSSIGITLPVTVTVGNRQFTDARIYSDGYVLLPAAARQDEPSNKCLPSTAAAGLSVFGWWSDLDPGRAGGRVSTFQAAANRFVIEFERVLVDGGAPGERASFQMTLYADGRVGVNYRDVPYTDGAPMPVTVGVQRQDGRFYNQIACVTSDIEVGTIPRSFQSLVLREEDLY